MHHSTGFSLEENKRTLLSAVTGQIISKSAVFLPLFTIAPRQSLNWLYFPYPHNAKNS